MGGGNSSAENLIAYIQKEEEQKNIGLINNIENSFLGPVSHGPGQFGFWKL